MAKKRTTLKNDPTDLLEELRPLLMINKHDLDEELVRQPQTFFKISEAAINAQARRDYLKEEVGRVDADLSVKHRKRIEQSGARATDAAVRSAVDGDPKHQKAVDAHIAARRDTDLFTALKESFHQRSYMIRDLSGLYLANYYERNAVEGGNQGKDVRGQRAMDKLNEKREAVNSRNSTRKRKKE